VDYVCLDCRAVQGPRIRAAGSSALSVVLWAAGLVALALGLWPALLVPFAYSTWRTIAPPVRTCRVCGGARLVPEDWPGLGNGPVRPLR
jgi:hypothetical protein